jgi:hypothetical protein
MTRSNFPNNVDSLPELSNILTSDQPNVDRYKTLLMQATRTSDEETELSNLKTTLATKLVDAEYFNFLSDAIVATQNYFLNQVKADLAKLDVGVLKDEIEAHATDLSDPHLSYYQATEWVKSFGIGTSSMSISTDLNTITANGFYFASNDAIHKPSINNGWVIVQYLNDNFQTQMFIDSIDGTVYLRNKINGVWNTWDSLRKDNPSYVKYYSPIDAFGLSANIWTSLLWNTNYGLSAKGVTFSQSKFTFTKRGIFLFTTDTALSGLTSGQHLRLRYLLKDSAGNTKGDDQSYVQSGYDTQSITNSNYIGANLSSVIKANVGDTLEIQAVCSEGSRNVRYVRVNAIESGDYNSQDMYDTVG